MHEPSFYDLYYAYLSKTTIPDDPKTRKARETLNQLNDKLIQTMGSKFMRAYENAEYEATAWEDPATFLAGYRLGVRLMLTALPYPSDSTSAP